MMSKIRKNTNEFFFRLIRPSTWYNALETSERVDEFVNKLIDSDSFVQIDGLRAVFNYHGKKIEIWIANFPYSYGNIMSVDDRNFGLENFGPSVSTRYRLAKYISSVAVDRFFGIKKENNA